MGAAQELVQRQLGAQPRARRVLAALLKLRALGAVADFDIGPECTAQWASLKYARVAAASVAAGVSDTGATD